MFEDEILQQFLVKAVEDAKKQIKDSAILSVESAIPLLLHSQYNHILHLEEKMATKDDIKYMTIKDDIKNMATKDDISRLEHEMSRMDGNIKQIEGTVKHLDGNVKHLDGNIKHLQWAIMYGFAIIAIIVPISTTIIIAVFTK
ncbi:MAG: hypothetical protein ABIJ30_04565 [bacterium]